MYTKLHKSSQRNFLTVMEYHRTPTVYRDRHYYDKEHRIWRLNKLLPPTSMERMYRIILDERNLRDWTSGSSPDRLMGKVRWTKYDQMPSNAYAKAFDNFVYKVKGEKATLIMTLGTMDKTFDMVNQAINRLSYITAKNKPRYLAERRKLRKAFNKPDREYDAKQMNQAKSWAESRASTKVADGWLMNSYGIQPIVTDLQQFNKVVKQKLDHLNEQIVGSYMEPITVDKTVVTASGYNNVVRRHIMNGYNGYTIRGRFSIDHPALAYAESMGLLNVGLLANDRIPFSFIVNYWTQHEAYIASLTAFAGISFRHLTVTRFSKCVLTYNETWTHRVSKRVTKDFGYTAFDENSERDAGLRAPPLPGITDRVKLVPSTGLKRLANTAALVRILSSK